MTGSPWFVFKLVNDLPHIVGMLSVDLLYLTAPFESVEGEYKLGIVFPTTSCTRKPSNQLQYPMQSKQRAKKGLPHLSHKVEFTQAATAGLPLKNHSKWPSSGRQRPIIQQRNADPARAISSVPVSVSMSLFALLAAHRCRVALV